MIRVVPPPSNSHHQVITFLVGDPYKPSFTTGILGGGTTQGMIQRDQGSLKRGFGPYSFNKNW